MVISIDRDGDIALVTVDNPPVNALGQALRQALWDAVAMLDADPAIRAVVLVCAGRTFIAGADVTEFGKPPIPPHLPDLVNRLEQAAKPWIAAIHGSALGGGFEVAMGCRFRVALDTASVGLPEVTLGIVPGASGTVRTPRLAGVAAAVELVTTGRPVKAARALSLGLLDAVVSGDLRAEALAFARRALTQPLPQPISARHVTAPDAAWWDDQRQTIARRAKGEIAPLRALDCLRIAAERPFAEAMAHERATFLDLRASDQAAALRHIFFAERAAPKPAHLGDVKPRNIRSAAVIGSGTTGAGIAASLRDAGLPVVLIDRDAEAVRRGLQNLRNIFDSAVTRGKLTEAEAQARMDGVTAGNDTALLADTDLVIEAVSEDLAIKRAVFARLGQTCRADAILATTASSLDPRLIAKGLPNTDRFIGLHFFTPANILKLMEIVPAPATSAETLATGFSLARMLNKIPVQAGACDGFIGNRILKRYRDEAETLVRQGTPVAAIDAAMRAHGFALGPFEAQDQDGLDIAYRQREGARAAGQVVPETLGDILVRAGRNGQKTGGGWYDYGPGDRTPKPSETTARLLAGRITIGPDLTPDDVAARLTAFMVDEGHKILADGIALKASDIDLVAVHGHGYPRWRGGPMFAASRGNSD